MPLASGAFDFGSQGESMELFISEGRFDLDFLFPMQADLSGDQYSTPFNSTTDM